MPEESKSLAEIEKHHRAKMTKSTSKSLRF